jgi:hypothetical protein
MKFMQTNQTPVASESRHTPETDAERERVYENEKDFPESYDEADQVHRRF